MPSYTCCSACRKIMVGLPPVIDCLFFFFLFSLLKTKMHNYSLHLLFVKSGMFVTPKYLRSGMAARPKSLESSMTVIPKARPIHLESGMVCQTQSAQVHAKLAHLGLLNLHPGVTTMLNPIVYMSSHWMRSRALFHMVQRVQKNNGWIAVGDKLFVFFLSFLS